jgi:hypothetical protein
LQVAAVTLRIGQGLVREANHLRGCAWQNFIKRMLNLVDALDVV